MILLERPVYLHQSSEFNKTVKEIITSMKRNIWNYLAAGIITAAGTSATAAPANHLLISEIGIGTVTQTNDQSSEYIEIYNPTSQPILLDNYFVSDTNAYTSLPWTADGKVQGNTTDHLLKFPAGTILAPGQVAVVTGGAINFFLDFFGANKANWDALAGDPLLFELGETDATVPNMTTLNNSVDRPLNFSITNPGTNNGEMAIIGYWNGKTDFVYDVDLAAWGSFTASNANQFTPKVAPNYFPDAGSHAVMNIGDSGNIVVRTSNDEGAEVSSPGNGLTGHDETTEAGASSFIIFSDRTLATPGLTSITLSLANVPPFVDYAERNKEFPTPADTITLTADVKDADGTIANVKFFVDSGSSYTEVAATAGSGNTYTANIGPFANNTLVKYYVVATDNNGATGTFPPQGAANPNEFVVNTSFAYASDVIINEILYDKIGTDNYEWLELHNRSNAPISLAFWRLRDLSEEYFLFPEDAVIPAKGFIVLSFNPTAMQADGYTIPAGVPIYTYPFSLGNATDSLFLTHVNSARFNGVMTHVDQVDYSNAAPWPATNSNVTGQSIELINPTLDNNSGANWNGSVVVTTGQESGTPGAANSQSNVNDWSMY